MPDDDDAQETYDDIAAVQPPAPVARHQRAPPEAPQEIYDDAMTSGAGASAEQEVYDDVAGVQGAQEVYDDVVGVQGAQNDQDVYDEAATATAQQEVYDEAASVPQEDGDIYSVSIVCTLNCVATENILKFLFLSPLRQSGISPCHACRHLYLMTRLIARSLTSNCPSTSSSHI